MEWSFSQYPRTRSQALLRTPKVSETSRTSLAPPGMPYLGADNSSNTIIGRHICNCKC